VSAPERPERRVLNAILASKRVEIARMTALPSLPPRRRPAARVVEALLRPAGEALRLIAEVKLRSPSAGDLSRALTPEARALAYARAGARMVSVLCDAAFFAGGFHHLAACRDALEAALGPDRPLLLCKDFILHEAQLDRALDAGADAALLIARITSPEALVALAEAARARGLEPLVEVVTEAELEAAKATGARLVGVNARDLDTLEMDPARAAHVLARVPPSAVAIHLSGLSAPEDVARVASPANGGGRAPDAALIGEALMRRDDPTPLLEAMVRAADVPRRCDR
jgi:indole-3-glycerol phosphate synthase